MANLLLPLVIVLLAIAVATASNGPSTSSSTTNYANVYYYSSSKCKASSVVLLQSNSVDCAVNPLDPTTYSTLACTNSGALIQTIYGDSRCTHKTDTNVIVTGPCSLQGDGEYATVTCTRTLPSLSNTAVVLRDSVVNQQCQNPFIIQAEPDTCSDGLIVSRCRNQNSLFTICDDKDCTQNCAAYMTLTQNQCVVNSETGESIQLNAPSCPNTHSRSLEASDLPFNASRSAAPNSLGMWAAKRMGTPKAVAPEEYSMLE